VTVTLATTARASAGSSPTRNPQHPRQERRRSPARTTWEPWRDWAVIALANHAMLLTIALLHLHGVDLLVASVPLAVGFAVGTLTVLHDAGHRMFGRRSLPNVLAVQTSTPLGLWVGHWTRKHRVHHKLSQVYPLDEATRSSAMVRFHPGAPRRAAHQWQHIYTWFLYGLAWMGELRSQLTYLRTGIVTGDGVTPAGERARSFVLEKLLCAAVLLPYALLLGVGRLGILLVASMTVASVLTAIALVVGHINEDLDPPCVPPGRDWFPHLMRTTASFSTDSTLMRYLTGGMTHHLVHHLRPLALRSEFPALHRTLVPDVVASTGLPHAEYATLSGAVAGHWRRLRELGQPDRVPVPCAARITMSVAMPIAEPGRTAGVHVSLQ
jgi:linoleoyl-CoA desaturase